MLSGDMIYENVKESTSCIPPRRVFNIRNGGRRVNSSSSDVRLKRKKIEINPFKVVMGTAVTNEQNIVQKHPPRRHFFISRLFKDVCERKLTEYCDYKGLKSIACRELPDKRPDMQSIHVIFPLPKGKLVQ